MISKKERMTMNRVERDLQKYDLELTPDAFFDHSTRSVCPVGLMVLGMSRDLYEAELICTVANHMSFLTKADSTIVAETVAEVMGLDVQYCRGLDSGVQGKTREPESDDPQEVANFWIGVADGDEIRKKYVTEG